MAPLALNQAAEEISNHHETSVQATRWRREQMAYRQCQSRTILSSLASAFIGFSVGYAVQVGGRRFIPGFVKTYHLIPLFLAAYIPTMTAKYMIMQCNKQYSCGKKYIRPTDTETQEDHVVL